MENLTIDIVIPIYFEGLNIRYLHTKKIFKYMKNLAKELINDKIILSFTVIGCDTVLSKNLYSDIFIHNSNMPKWDGDKMCLGVTAQIRANYLMQHKKISEVTAQKQIMFMEFPDVFGIDNTYIIFNQGDYRRPTDFYHGIKFQNILNNKFGTGIKHSIKKNKDIIMFMGSNDLICKEFYKQIRDKFNKNEKQFYGINNTNNNSVIFFDLNDQLKLNDKSILGCWDGHYPMHYGRTVKQQYAGGTVGFNKRTYEDLFLHMPKWNGDKMCAGVTGQNRVNYLMRVLKMTEDAARRQIMFMEFPDVYRFNFWSNECMIENYCNNELHCKLILCECIYYLNIKTDNDITPKKECELIYKKIKTINEIKIINEPIYNSLIETIKYYNNLPLSNDDVGKEEKNHYNAH